MRKLCDIGLGNDFVNDTKGTRNKNVDQHMMLRRSPTFCAINEILSKDNLQGERKRFCWVFYLFKRKDLETIYPKRC